MDILSTIKRIAQRENIEGQSEFLSKWLDYYQGTQSALNYKVYNGTRYKRKRRKTLKIQKKICQDFADFILN